MGRPQQTSHSAPIVFIEREALTMERNGVSDTLRLCDI